MRTIRPASIVLRIGALAVLAGSLSWPVLFDPPSNLSTTRYSDPGQGFSIDLPPGMEIDRSLGEVATVLSDEQTRVEVLHENGLPPDAHYIWYKRLPIVERLDPVTVVYDGKRTILRWTVHQLRWTRPALKHIPRDHNFYATFDLISRDGDLWSIHVKSADPSWIPRNAESIIRSFATFPPTEAEPPAARRASARAAPLSPGALEIYAWLFDSERQTWGIFEPNWDRGLDGLHALEARLHHSFRVLLEYIDIDEKRTPAILEMARDDGRLVELTLQLNPPAGDPSSTFIYQLLNGDHDSALRRIAAAVARFADPVLFRLNNEMNGDWTTYSAYHTSEDAEIFKALWRHVFSIFQEEGASNAIWIWNPHDRSFPPFKYNHMLMYDPGPEYYDVVGLTGYNNGTYYPNETWRSFDEIYRPIYEEARRLFPTKPLMITEFASSTIGGDKVAWIRDAMVRLRSYPDIKLAVWWNGVDMDGATPARPYRLEGDDVLAAFADGLAQYR